MSGWCYARSSPLIGYVSKPWPSEENWLRCQCQGRLALIIPVVTSSLYANVVQIQIIWWNIPQHISTWQITNKWMARHINITDKTHFHTDKGNMYVRAYISKIQYGMDLCLISPGSVIRNVIINVKKAAIWYGIITWCAVHCFSSVHCTQCIVQI